MTSIVPAVVENHLDALQHLENGTAILASSNLTGRYWGGSLWCFKNTDDAPDIEKCITGLETESGISDVATFGKDKIIIGLDSGAVELISLQSEPTVFSSLFYASEHDHSVTSVSVSAENLLCISSSADGCIKVWDTESWTCVATYRPAHGDMIYNVSCSTINHQLFLSCGQDDKVCLWDLRLPKPASVLDKTPLKGAPTAVSWKPESSNEFAAGDQTGFITFKDIRNCSEPLLSGQPHQRPLFRFAFSPSFPSWLASCADEENVVVMDIGKEKLEVIYKDSSHSDFVRGLSWHPVTNKLYSCGWNKEVFGHNLSNDVMELGGHGEFS